MGLLKIPFARHILAGVIILGIGLFAGLSIMNKKLQKVNIRAQIAEQSVSKAEGRNESLKVAYQQLETRTDTLQKYMLILAQKEHLKIDNHISDIKLKKGGSIDFRPNTEGAIIKTDSLKVKKKKRGWLWW